MKLTRAQAKALSAFRRSPYAAALQEIFAQELQERRHAYEETLADEGQRGYILGVRAVSELLFSSPIEVEN